MRHCVKNESDRLLVRQLIQEALSRTDQSIFGNADSSGAGKPVSISGLHAAREALLAARDDGVYDEDVVADGLVWIDAKEIATVEELRLRGLRGPRLE